MGGLTRELDDIFASVGAQGCLHAVDIDSGAEAAYHADAPAVTASIFKIFVSLELLWQVAEGRAELTERVRIDGPRTLGPTGLSVMRDPAELSLRDLIYLMMAISDNHATDVLCARAGIDNINARLRALGLETTRVVGDCDGMFEMMREDYGVRDLSEVDRNPEPYIDRIRACRAMDPAHANRTTARELTSLLARTWRNEIATPEVCAGVRASMSVQHGPHRLVAGFPQPDVRVWGKTGTLPHVRGEAGVMRFPDGRRFAVAVLMRLDSRFLRYPAADEAIGRAAAAAVRSLGAPM